MSEHRVVGAVRELLRPVDHHRFEEAATTQLKEGNQIPDHTQAAEAEKRVRTRTESADMGSSVPKRCLNSLVGILSEGDRLLEFPLLEHQGGPLS